MAEPNFDSVDLSHSNAVEIDVVDSGKIEELKKRVNPAAAQQLTSLVETFRSLVGKIVALNLL